MFISSSNASWLAFGKYTIRISDVTQASLKVSVICVSTPETYKGSVLNYATTTSLQDLYNLLLSSSYWMLHNFSCSKNL